MASSGSSEFRFGDVVHIVPASGHWLVLVAPEERWDKKGYLLALNDDEAGGYPGVTRWSNLRAFELVERLTSEVE